MQVIREHLIQFYITARFPIDKLYILKYTSEFTACWIPLNLLSNIKKSMKEVYAPSSHMLAVYIDCEPFHIAYSDFIKTETFESDLVQVLSSK